MSLDIAYPKSAPVDQGLHSEPTIWLGRVRPDGRPHLVPLSDSEWLASQIPQSHLHVVPGAGHVPTVTRRLEVAEAIDRCFAR